MYEQYSRLIVFLEWIINIFRITPVKVVTVFFTVLLLSLLLLFSCHTHSQSKYFKPAGHLLIPKYNLNATLLKDGKILLTGIPATWADTEVKRLHTAELYDPVTEKSRLISPKSCIPFSESTTLLHDGRVLLYGSEDWDLSPDCTKVAGEVYDPKRQVFEALIEPYYIVAGPTAPSVVLEDGKVLFLGQRMESHKWGYSGGNIIEFNPETYKFKHIGRLLHPRKDHSAIQIDKSHVLIFGGTDATSGNGIQHYVQDVEMYDVVNNKSRIVGKLKIENDTAPTLTRLRDGNILISGGSSQQFPISPKTLGARLEVEMFNPKTMTSQIIGKFNIPKLQPGSTLLPDGRVLFTGGENFEPDRMHDARFSVELYDPKTQKFTVIDKLLYGGVSIPIQTANHKFYFFDNKIQRFDYEKFTNDYAKGTH